MFLCHIPASNLTSGPQLVELQGPVSLLKVTQILLGGSISEINLCEEYIRHLTGAISWIRFALDTSIEAGPVKVMHAKPCKVIWEKFDPIEPKEVVRVLVAV